MPNANFGGFESEISVGLPLHSNSLLGYAEQDGNGRPVPLAGSARGNPFLATRHAGDGCLVLQWGPAKSRSVGGRGVSNRPFALVADTRRPQGRNRAEGLARARRSVVG